MAKIIWHSAVAEYEADRSVGRGTEQKKKMNSVENSAERQLLKKKRSQIK